MATCNKNQTPQLLAIRSFRSMTATRLKERIIFASLAACALFTLLITVSIIVLLLVQTFEFFAMPETNVSDFLFGTQWNPTLGEEKHFGIWPLICGTMLVTVIAMAVALPSGLITAIYLSEYAPLRLRNVLKPTLELLAGIPTVVYGFFALAVITPFLKQWLGIEVDYYNALSAGIAVGILCLPTVASLSEDALTRCSSQPARSRLWIGRNEVRRFHESRFSGSAIGNRIGFFAGRCSGDWRNDDRIASGRKFGPTDGRSSKPNPDDDRTHDSDGQRRSLQFRRGVLFHLLGRPGSIFHDSHPDIHW
jgi:hypothetical protein